MDRCRLVLIVEPEYQTEAHVGEAVAGGDIASMILLGAADDDHAFQSRCEKVIPIIQAAGIAALIANDTQVVGRTEADGIFLDGDRSHYKELIARFSPQKIAGCGNIKDRHIALEVGEMGPDFMFFGKPSGDIKPEAHKKSLALAEWWSDKIEIPCIVMAGSSLESVIDCAATNAEFVALNKAVFMDGDGPKQAVAKANALLEEHAPALEFDD